MLLLTGAGTGHSRDTRKKQTTDLGICFPCSLRKKILFLCRMCAVIPISFVSACVTKPDLTCFCGCVSADIWRDSAFLPFLRRPSSGSTLCTRCEYEPAARLSRDHAAAVSIHWVDAAGYPACPAGTCHLTQCGRQGKNPGRGQREPDLQAGPSVNV